nr:immunoglobulin heavy chain junction region [Mus musculus]MBK4189571.1 immunoglobulin heavy chain junction region [Mus musculus]MBK4189572.1 immunoglobulin heavy chain junction region [Mus musculus]
CARYDYGPFAYW